MPPTDTIKVVPTVEETYHPGKHLQLYSHLPPIPPDDKDCYTKDPFKRSDDDVFTELYGKSIDERLPIPSTPPDVSITLEERFVSGMENIPHVWLAHVQAPSQHVYPSKLVAKIYDPAWFGDAVWFDSFKLRNLLVSQEVETYRRLENFQGTKIPRFYGHFITPLPSQQNRTVNVILLELIPGRDLHLLVPPETASAVCSMHNSAVVEVLMVFVLNMEACGVRQMDLQPRNVILLPPEECGEFCASSVCPLRFKADCGNLRIVMIDFERVDYIDPRFLGGEERKEIMDRGRPRLLSEWLDGRM